MVLKNCCDGCRRNLTTDQRNKLLSLAQEYTDAECKVYYATERGEYISAEILKAQSDTYSALYWYINRL